MIYVVLIILALIQNLKSHAHINKKLTTSIFSIKIDVFARYLHWINMNKSIDSLAGVVSFAWHF